MTARRYDCRSCLNPVELAELNVIEAQIRIIDENRLSLAARRDQLMKRGNKRARKILTVANLNDEAVKHARS